MRFNTIRLYAGDGRQRSFDKHDNETISLLWMLAKPYASAAAETQLNAVRLPVSELT